MPKKIEKNLKDTDTLQDVTQNTIPKNELPSEKVVLKDVMFGGLIAILVFLGTILMFKSNYFNEPPKPNPSLFSTPKQDPKVSLSVVEKLFGDKLPAKPETWGDCGKNCLKGIALGIVGVTIFYFTWHVVDFNAAQEYFKPFLTGTNTHTNLIYKYGFSATSFVVGGIAKSYNFTADIIGGVWSYVPNFRQPPMQPPSCMSNTTPVVKHTMEQVINSPKSMPDMESYRGSHEYGHPGASPSQGWDYGSIDSAQPNTARSEPVFGQHSTQDPRMTQTPRVDLWPKS